MVKRGWLLIRIIIGGLFVFAFAVLGESLKPKSFAGLFGTAPSVALATLLLTIRSQGAVFAAIEAHAMIFGHWPFSLRLHRLLLDNALQVAGINCRDGLYYHLARHRPRDRRGHMIIGVDFSDREKRNGMNTPSGLSSGGLNDGRRGLDRTSFRSGGRGSPFGFSRDLPASITLVEKHERQNKKRAGLQGTCRGREAAALDSVGAALGSIALIAFAAIVWGFLESYPPAIVLAGDARCGRVSPPWAGESDALFSNSEMN
jgi:hypothetical protein